MAKKKSARYICPHCYGNIDLSQVHYSCNNPECVGNFLAKCNSSEKRRYASKYHPDEEIDWEKSEHLGLDPRGEKAVTTTHHIIRGSVDGTCDVCRKRDTYKICPKCHEQISESSARNGTTIVLAMGNDTCGKSHYLSSLISVMESEYSKEIMTSFKPASDRAAEKYRREFRDPVIEGKVLPPTRSYTEENSRDPLLFDLGEDGDEDARTIAFFDTSGEDLDSGSRFSQLNISTYIAGASGIMFFIDPLQIPTIRAKLALPALENEYQNPEDALMYISQVIRDNNKMKARQDIDIPLAVIITRADLLIRSPSGAEDESALFGPESSLHIERARDYPDLVNINQIGAELEEYIRRNIGEGFLDEVNKYTYHQFFAVSALGADPVDGKLVKGAAPFRVEDPMIWFLNNNTRRKWF